MSHVPIFFFVSCSPPCQTPAAVVNKPGRTNEPVVRAQRISAKQWCWRFLFKIKREHLWTALFTAWLLERRNEEYFNYGMTMLNVLWPSCCASGHNVIHSKSLKSPAVWPFPWIKKPWMLQVHCIVICSVLPRLIYCGQGTLNIYFWKCIGCQF